MSPEELDRVEALLASARKVDGCSDHGCVLRVYRRGGMGTNGGCHCVERDDADGMVAVRSTRLDLTRLLALARKTPALVAEVRRLRTLVEHLTPPEPTPLTDTQRSNLDALLSAHTGPGAVCEHSPASDVTRRELVEAEAAARALGDDARARVASLGLRVYWRYDRERDRVHEVSAILEAAREALGCETWSEVPASVAALRVAFVRSGHP